MKIYNPFNILVICLITIANGELINYNSLYHQGAACTSGRMQSPIDLKDDISVFNSTINLLSDRYHILNNAKLEFDERILYISNSNEDPTLGTVTLSRNGVLKRYALKRIEFIFPGEHKMNGTTPDLEVKFIHEQLLDYQSNVNQYRKLSDANTNMIISILYHTDSKITDGGFLNSLSSTLNGSSITLDVESYGLIRDKQYYFYEGSFSFNPCNENVNHIVLKNPFYISEETKKIFYNVFNSRYTNADTSKEVSKIYGRNIFRNYMVESDLSAGFIKSFAFLLIILIFN